MKFKLIVAFNNYGTIGNKGKIPWNIKEDLEYFKKTTMGDTLIMGRKTFESLKAPLPGRVNIVLSRDKDYKHDGISVAHSMDAAIEYAVWLNLGKNIWFMGGEHIYKEAMMFVDEMHMTIVEDDTQGDTKFLETSVFSVLKNWYTHTQERLEEDGQGYIRTVIRNDSNYQLPCRKNYNKAK